MIDAATIQAMQGSPGPAMPYLAKPAPLHYGDFYGSDVGPSTVFQATQGYDLTYGVSDADVGAIATRVSAVAGARMAAAAPAANWMQTAGAGILLLAAIAWYLEARVG